MASSGSGKDFLTDLEIPPPPPPQPCPRECPGRCFPTGCLPGGRGEQGERKANAGQRAAWVWKASLNEARAPGQAL